MQTILKKPQAINSPSRWENPRPMPVIYLPSTVYQALLLLSQVRQGTLECAGANTAGPRRCLGRCQSLHNYKAETPLSCESRPPEEPVIGNVFVGAWCPRSLFMLDLLSAPSSLLFDHQHMHQGCFALRNPGQSCLTHPVRQWQHQSPSWHCLLTSVPKLTSTQQEGQTSRCGVQKRIQSSLSIPTTTSVSKT